eukprot:9474764-Pyramimonas_sp.AAC.1
MPLKWGPKEYTPPPRRFLLSPLSSEREGGREVMLVYLLGPPNTYAWPGHGGPPPQKRRRPRVPAATQAARQRLRVQGWPSLPRERAQG